MKRGRQEHTKKKKKRGATFLFCVYVCTSERRLKDREWNGHLNWERKRNNKAYKPLSTHPTLQTKTFTRARNKKKKACLFSPPSLTSSFCSFFFLSLSLFLFFLSICWFLRVSVCYVLSTRSCCPSPLSRVRCHKFYLLANSDLFAFLWRKRKKKKGNVWEEEKEVRKKTAHARTPTWPQKKKKDKDTPRANK